MGAQFGDMVFVVPEGETKLSVTELSLLDS